MRIAVAADGGMVSQHFGRCPEYIIYDVSGNKVISRQVLPNPGHQPGFIPGYLGDMGVSCVIAGGMGPRAQALFEERGIQTVVGARGPADEVVNSFLAGQLPLGESTCDHPYGEDHHN
ncbi:MAG TPA: dinitrogenase iron-molybdenum cofactor [Firmicutes bacterium]|nr:dinitrogenase iron-molybdenum cofactor [Bacillota bacterium]